MEDAASYWSTLCDLVSQLRPYWVRIAWKDGDTTEEGDWGQLLTVPTEGYLEGSSGVIRFRDVAWVDMSTVRVNGGMAGRPLQMIDVKDEVLASLRGTQLIWELRETTWSLQRVFEEEPVQVIRVANPFRED